MGFWGGKGRRSCRIIELCSMSRNTIYKGRFSYAWVKTRSFMRVGQSSSFSLKERYELLMSFEDLFPQSRSHAGFQMVNEKDSTGRYVCGHLI